MINKLSTLISSLSGLVWTTLGLLIYREPHLEDRMISVSENMPAVEKDFINVD